MMPQSRLHGLAPAIIHSVVTAAGALESGRADDAERALRVALASNPDHPEILRLQAGVLNLRGNTSRALSLMQCALALRPQDALYHNTLASILADAGDLNGAVDALQRACLLQPDLAIAWYNLGVMLVRDVRLENALVALERTIELAPDHMQARAQYADVLRMLDRTGEAIAEYRKILAAVSWLGMAWSGLANIKTFRFDNGDVARMNAALSDSRASADDRVAVGFALAKALDDEGRHAQTLAALEQANHTALKLMSDRGRRWDRIVFSNLVDSVLSVRTDRALSENDEFGQDVIFIVGLPRSGTTLVEQILASHSHVEGAGELPDLPLILMEEMRGAGKPYAPWASEMDSRNWRRLGERYLQDTRRWRLRKRMFTDKLPGNWNNIGAIRAMLPGARIICCRRDALETCFSCYRQYLQGNEYSRTFEDLAAYWRDYDRSVRHWRAIFPARIYEHSYEELLTDPETSIRALLDFCGLPFEKACLDFHLTRRAVRSPSAMQVRQPLRRDTARAQEYGALLDPLRHALGLSSFSHR